MPTRKASASWNGGFKGGTGRIDTETGAVAAEYSAGSRFESASGTNPEELLAAAEAACYSMALTLALESAGMNPNSVNTTAHCTIEKVEGGFAITTMKLDVQADVPGAERDAFNTIAEKTLTGCPVSKALQGNVKLELNATLA